MKNKKIFLIIGLALSVFSCSFIQRVSLDVLKKSDPYSPKSKKIEEIIDTTIKASKVKVVENTVTTVQTNTEKVVETKTNDEIKTSVGSTKLSTEKEVKTTENESQVQKVNVKSSSTDTKFDETDIKIVDFIAEKVTENSVKIKELTILGVTQLKNQKNISISKREFLARTYQVMKENNINSYAVASKKMMSTLSK